MDNHDSWTVPVQFENVLTLKRGTEAVKDINELEKFIRLTITPVSSEQRDVGGNADRFEGLITVQVLIKAGLGSNLGRKIADEIYYAFNRANIDGLQCRSTYIDVFPNTQDGWYQINVNTPYYRDVVFSPPLIN